MIDSRNPFFASAHSLSVLLAATALLHSTHALCEPQEKTPALAEPERVQPDFKKILQDAKATPIEQGGKTVGFKLSAVKEDSVYARMGLQNGDVIESINGQELVDAAQTIQTLDAMRNETSIEVRFERDGKVQSRRIEVK